MSLPFAIIEAQWLARCWSLGAGERTREVPKSVREAFWRQAVTADDNGIELGGFKMIAVSPAMKQLLTFARRVAQSEVSTVLLEGESGTGKDVLAQFLHYYGRRHEGPFVPLNCAAIPETLLESELFGYEKGAFTDARTAKAGILEIASSGSIFLDEIAEMPLTVQAKLLRVLEGTQCFRRGSGRSARDIQVDVRVVGGHQPMQADR